MKKIRIGVCGCYAKDVIDYGGQPVKTRILIDELSKMYGAKEVKVVDTFKWKKKAVQFLIECIILAIGCKNIVILPAANGIKTIAPLFLILSKVFSFKVYYVVIGGWINIIQKTDIFLSVILKKINFIFVETNSIKNQLEQQGFKNVLYMPNMKNLVPAKVGSIENSYDNDFKFCFFSRIVEKKGIEDAINAIIHLNSEGIKCYLDIYGMVYDSYKAKFSSIINHAPSYIKYKGYVNPSESVDTIKKYYMQLFPTKYKTEGLPGSIIDSFFAGVPVIASKWDSFSDFIDDGKNGIGFEFLNYTDLIRKLKWSINNPQLICVMKKECLKKAKEFIPEKAMINLLKHL